MATKKVSYKNLLKEAISEFDTSKTVEVKGPMLDPILSWDGDGELPVYKDAASILERYYFNEDQDDQITVNDLEEMEYNEDGTAAKTPEEKHGEGTGTNQAGTSNASGIRAMEKDQEKDIAKEMVDIFTEDDDKDEDEKEDKKEDKEEEEMEEALAMFFSEQEDDEAPAEDKGDDDKDLDVDKGVEEAVVSEKEFDDKDVPKKKEYTDESDDVTEDIENAVIEKLIDEMEDVDEAEIMGYTGDGVKKGMEAPQEKKAKGPEEDTEGAGTEQAGTGTDAGQVPPRKDMADQMVKPKNYSSEQAAPSAVPGGPSPNKSGEDEDMDDGYNEESADLAEAFEIFKEAIEEDDDASEEDIKV
jgi:hypothetical protein